MARSGPTKEKKNWWACRAAGLLGAPFTKRKTIHSFLQFANSRIAFFPKFIQVVFSLLIHYLLINFIYSFQQMLSILSLCSIISAIVLVIDKINLITVIISSSFNQLQSSIQFHEIEWMKELLILYCFLCSALIVFIFSLFNEMLWVMGASAPLPRRNSIPQTHSVCFISFFLLSSNQCPSEEERS